MRGCLCVSASMSCCCLLVISTCVFCAMQGLKLEACRDTGDPTPALHEDESTHDSGSELSQIPSLPHSPAAAAAVHPATQDAAAWLEVDDGPHIQCSLSDLSQRMRKRRKLEPCADSISTFEEQHAFAAASLQVELSSPQDVLRSVFCAHANRSQ